MPETPTGTFRLPGAARTAHEDIIASGCSSEMVLLGRRSWDLKVIASNDNSPESREILARHAPTETEVNGSN